MIYLASPYSHPDPAIREERYIRASKVLVELYLWRELWAYSPIVHCHELAKTFQLPRDAQFWKGYNTHMLLLATELHVIRLDGWDTSAGVQFEVDTANKAEIPVRYV